MQELRSWVQISPQATSNIGQVVHVPKIVTQKRQQLSEARPVGLGFRGLTCQEKHGTPTITFEKDSGPDRSPLGQCACVEGGGARVGLQTSRFRGLWLLG